MKAEHLKILTNIIGAVESGGQVYGKRNYAAYAGKGKNSENEKTCTLGWAQNYGPEATKLCKMILKADPEAFRKADSAGIEKKLAVDWVETGWDPSPKEKAALIAIITTEAGKKCQDQLFEQLMENYIKAAEEYGVKDIAAQMMWCEINHLGGGKPVRRIFDRAKKPYTPDTIFDSLLLDQKDNSNTNQVGDKKFQKRHECCVKWIKKYVIEEEEETMAVYSRQKVVDKVTSWEGLKESDGSHKKIIDIYNSKQPFPRGVKMQPDMAWCAATWSAEAKALDYTAVMPVEISCYYIIERAKEMGCWVENDAYVPKPGDAVLYDWEDKGTGDNTGNPDHIGTVIYVNEAAGYMVVMEGNYSNAVKRRTISINGKYIRGFITPKYTDNTVADPEHKPGKDVTTVAREVIAGQWGNDPERSKELKSAGYDPKVIQAKVNEILNGSAAQAADPTKEQSQSQQTTKKVTATCKAKYRDNSLAGTYKTTANLYIRNDAGTNKKALALIPKGTPVQCYGYYNKSGSVKWLYIQVKIDGVLYTGFSSSAFLKK